VESRRVRVELVNPGRPRTGIGTRTRLLMRGLAFYKQTLPTLAALAPPWAEVSATDENVERLKVRYGVDVLGISITTAFATRGYQIADLYREAYRTVGQPPKIVFGGSHASALPEEALQHGDAVVVGDAEESWPRLLEDFRGGCLKDVYNSPMAGSEDSGKDAVHVLPKREVLKGKSWITVDGLQMSRGCPRNCEFCSIGGTGKPVVRTPLAVVAKDLAQCRSRYLAVLDDNFFGNVSMDRDYIHQVLDLLRYHKKRWFCQMPLYAGKQEWLVQEMVASGCLGVYLGIDSLAETRRGTLTKNGGGDDADVLRSLKDAGLVVMGGFVFGFDSEGPEVFDESIAYAEQTRLNLASFHVLTPYPGTRLYKRLKSEGRLLSDGAWEKYDTAHVVFEPRLMSAEQLATGFRKAWRTFYSPSSIFRRSLGSHRLHIPINAAYGMFFSR